MYLEPEDYGYEKHLVQVPVIPEGGYQGKVNEFGQPVDMEEYKAWIKSLPLVWQDNPFHNHFIQVDPDTSDEEIMDIAEAFLHECYIKWAQDLNLASVEHQPRNDILPFVRPGNISEARKLECEVKATMLKSSLLERKVQWLP
jgi:hypothetical protein